MQIELKIKRALFLISQGIASAFAKAMADRGE